jgi:hypothetical protein
MTKLELIVSTTVSVLVGGMIPVLTLLLTEWLARRRRLAEWFEKIYIEECIDPLHDCFCGWALNSSRPTRNVQESLANPALGEVPIGAASRLMTLTGSIELQNWLNAMRGLRLRAAGRNDFNGWTKFQCHAMSIAQHLDTLRKELLPQKVRSKSAVYGFRNLACVKTFNETLKKLMDDIVDDPNVTKYTATSSDPSAES